MDRDELMQMAAEKAVKELEWKSIEYLFKPVDMFTLLLRVDFEGMKKKINDFYADNSPAATPHRFRAHYYPITRRAIEVEEFYIKLKSVKQTGVDSD